MPFFKNIFKLVFFFFYKKKECGMRVHQQINESILIGLNTCFSLLQNELILVLIL